MKIHFTHRSYNFDSILLPLTDTKFGMTLQFRIHLVRVEPTDHHAQFGDGSWINKQGVLITDDGHYQLEPWNDLEWQTYQRDFVGVITRNWSDKFTLVPNKTWYVPRQGAAKTSATIDCGLSIQLVDSAALHPHVTIMVIHPREHSFRSWAYHVWRRSVLTHRDLEFTWRLRKTKVGTQTHRVEFGQITALHEFGHLLAFDHVNGETNDDSAYGVTYTQREDLMGMGYHFDPRMARPWQRRLSQHLVPENHYDRTVRFTTEMRGLQIIAVWDNDEVLPTPAPQTPPATSNNATGGTGSTGQVVHGPAGVVWNHLTNVPSGS